MDEPALVTYEQENEFGPPVSVPASAGFAHFVLKRGWAKNAVEAEKMLLGSAIAIVCLAICVWFFFLRADRSGQAEQGPLEPIPVSAAR